MACPKVQFDSIGFCLLALRESLSASLRRTLLHDAEPSGRWVPSLCAVARPRALRSTRETRGTLLIAQLHISAVELYRVKSWKIPRVCALS
jgi:hypothetical protein